MLKTIALLACASLASACAQTSAGGPQLSHDVFFTLHDRSDQAKAKLVQACHRRLKGHQGEVFFSAGVLAQDLTRDVNDRDFDVSLHIVFRTKADHDRYAVHERHTQFIKENSASWKKVRVFDSYLK
jgi:hypothetical protein